ncbi:hypothetical protein BGX38DRAFT_1145965 [Terfezia claveryi]|nr:hypothetical protein BGX38DRAFT_1145965 [Terfezia claveryi]
MVIIALVMVIAVVTMARQMREMGGDFLLDSLLDVVSVNVKMLVIFLDVDDLDSGGGGSSASPSVQNAQLNAQLTEHPHEQSYHESVKTGGDPHDALARDAERQAQYVGP